MSDENYRYLVNTYNYIYNLQQTIGIIFTKQVVYL